MSVFKRDREIKRMIFNVYADVAEALEALKAEAKRFDKRLDVDTAVNKALEKFLRKAEKRIDEMKRATKDKNHKPFLDSGEPDRETTGRGDGPGAGEEAQGPSL